MDKKYSDLERKARAEGISSEFFRYQFRVNPEALSILWLISFGRLGNILDGSRTNNNVFCTVKCNDSRLPSMSGKIPPQYLSVCGSSKPGGYGQTYSRL